MKYCPWPYCNVKVKFGYCSMHEKSRKKMPRARIDTRTAHRRGYDPAWNKVKNAYLAKHPYCENCHEPAEEVHHIIPIKDGGDRLSFSNLKAVCKVCHWRIHDTIERRKQQSNRGVN